MKTYPGWFWDVAFICFLFSGVAAVTGLWNIQQGQPFNTPIPQPAHMFFTLGLLILLNLYLKLSDFTGRTGASRYRQLSYFDQIIILSPLLFCVILLVVVNAISGLPLATGFPKPWNGLVFGSALFTMFLLIIYRSWLRRNASP